MKATGSSCRAKRSCANSAPRCRRHSLGLKVKLLPPAKRQAMRPETAAGHEAKAKRRSRLKVVATSQRKTASRTSIVKMQTAKLFMQAMDDRIVLREEIVLTAVEAAVAAVAVVVGIAEVAVEAVAEIADHVAAEAEIAAEIANLSN